MVSLAKKYDIKNLETIKNFAKGLNPVMFKNNSFFEGRAGYCRVINPLSDWRVSTTSFTSIYSNNFFIDVYDLSGSGSAYILLKNDIEESLLFDSVLRMGYGNKQINCRVNNVLLFNLTKRNSATRIRIWFDNGVARSYYQDNSGLWYTLGTTLYTVTEELFFAFAGQYQNNGLQYVGYGFSNEITW